MRTREVTYTELLLVVVIFAVFSVAFVPCFTRMKNDAQTRAVKQNLWGFLKGLQVYQSQNDQKVEFGPAQDMGLPPIGGGYAEFANSYTGDYSYDWNNRLDFLPCGLLPSPDMAEGIGYTVNVIPFFEQDVVQYRENQVILYDVNCNPPETELFKTDNLIRSIGISLNGQFRDRSHHGGYVRSMRFYR